MRSHGLGIKLRRRFVRTTDIKHDSPIFPNLYRNVIPTRPNVVWVADFIYIRIASGFCYLAAILDACSRKVVGYLIWFNESRPHYALHLRSPMQFLAEEHQCNMYWRDTAERHPYQLPEIVRLDLTDGSAAYLRWIDEQTAAPPPEATKG